MALGNLDDFLDKDGSSPRTSSRPTPDRQSSTDALPDELEDLRSKSPRRNRRTRRSSTSSSKSNGNHHSSSKHRRNGDEEGSSHHSRSNGIRGENPAEEDEMPEVEDIDDDDDDDDEEYDEFIVDDDFDDGIGLAPRKPSSGHRKSGSSRNHHSSSRSSSKSSSRKSSRRREDSSDHTEEEGSSSKDHRSSGHREHRHESDVSDHSDKPHRRSSGHHSSSSRRRNGDDDDHSSSHNDSRAHSSSRRRDGDHHDDHSSSHGSRTHSPKPRRRSSVEHRSSRRGSCGSYNSTSSRPVVEEHSESSCYSESAIPSTGTHSPKVYRRRLSSRRALSTRLNNNLDDISSPNLAGSSRPTIGASISSSSTGGAASRRLSAHESSRSGSISIRSHHRLGGAIDEDSESHFDDSESFHCSESLASPSSPGRVRAKLSKSALDRVTATLKESEEKDELERIERSMNKLGSNSIRREEQARKAKQDELVAAQQRRASERMKRLEGIRQRIIDDEAQEKQNAEVEEARKQAEVLAHYHSEAGRRERAYAMYYKSGMMNRDALKKKIQKKRNCDVTEADIDLLPWTASGSMVNVAKMHGNLSTKGLAATLPSLK